MFANKNKLPKRTYSRKPMEFDLEEFIKYYDNLTDEQWDILIDLCAKQGYDIRCIHGYKKDMGDRFTILFIYEVLDVLLALEDCAKYISRIDGPETWFWDGQVKKDIQERYERFGLPIPKYWRELLWT